MSNKTIKEEAKEYTPMSKTKNVSELPSISVDLLMEDESFKDSEDKDVNIKVVTVDDEKYRIPVSVVRDLKVILEDNPDLKNFKVKKTGTGMETRYTVIPLV